MHEKNQKTNPGSAREKKRTEPAENRRTQGGSHAVKRRVRLDRIAVVVVPLLLIVILIGALCFYSCDRQSQDEEAATVTTTDVAQTSTAQAQESTATDATESDASSQETSGDSTQITLNADAVGTGNLIVINAAHAYTFSEDDSQLQYVYEQRNDSYGVSDLEVQLEAETLSQLNAMMADFESETGYSSLQVFSGYRTKEDKDSRYENGTSTFQGGYSDYHSGRTLNLKINFGDGTSDYYDAEKYPDYSWIAEHAAEYGFVVRYPAEKESITGEESRTYTFRYVGVPHAMYMTEHDLCLEEYVDLLQSFTVEDPLVITAEDTEYKVFYVPADGEDSVDVTIASENYTVSGDNMDGFIVTCF